MDVTKPFIVEIRFMSGRKLFSWRCNQTVLAIALAIVTLVSVFVPSAIASRPPSRYITLSSDWVNVGSGQSISLSWQCPTDRGAISGGLQTEGVSGNAAAGFKVINSYPEDYRTWRLRLYNSDDIARNVKIYTVCGLS